MEALKWICKISSKKLTKYMIYNKSLKEERDRGFIVEGREVHWR